MDFRIWLWYHIFALVWKATRGCEAHGKIKAIKEEAKRRVGNDEEIIRNEKKNGTIIWQLSSNGKTNIGKIRGAEREIIPKIKSVNHWAKIARSWRTIFSWRLPKALKMFTLKLELNTRMRIRFIISYWEI